MLLLFWYSSTGVSFSSPLYDMGSNVVKWDIRMNVNVSNKRLIAGSVGRSNNSFIAGRG